jgi:hypothetical protein
VRGGGPTDLKEILNRRSDLSTFLVHLTRDFKGKSADDRLASILRDRKLEAKSIYGLLRDRRSDLTDAAKDAQKVVCFTETPLEYAYLMMQKIDGREYEFGPYGVAITKKMGRIRGVNPVWYLDITPGHDWLTVNANALAMRFINGGCIDKHLAALFPFMEQMGTGTRASDGQAYKKEFWWEREWRHRGDFDLEDSRFICLCPEDEMDDFEELIEENEHEATCLDPRWSLEKVIAKLSGFPAWDVDIG